MPVTVHLVQGLEGHAGAGRLAGQAEDLRRAREGGGSARNRLQSCQQVPGVGHDRGNRTAGIDQAAEHQRPVQERKTAGIVMKTLGVEAEWQAISSVSPVFQDRLTSA